MSFPFRRECLLVGVFCLVPLLNFPGAFLSDRTLFLRDIAMVWAPQVESVVQQVGRGEFPSFDGRRGFGQPLFADPRAEVLYPPSWIHWILPVERSYALFAALHLVIAALGAARLARRLVPGASLVAQATAGVAYAAGGPMVSLVSHWHHLAAAAWMPWIIEQSDTREGEKTPWFGLAALVALQVLAGSPDYTFTTFLMCVLLMLTRGRPGKARFQALGAMVLGLSLSAVQLLPSLVFAREAARERFPIGWALSPLHPALTLETVVPIRAETWPLRPEARTALFNDGQVWMFSHYLGLSVWALALAGLARGNPAVRFAAGSVALGLVLSLGVRSEELQSMVGQIPLVSGLRFPTKHLAASSLGLSLLAAFGVMTPAPWRVLVSRRIIALLIGSLAAVAALFSWSTDPGVAFDAMALVQPLAACACVVAFLIVRRKTGLLPAAALPALVAIDLLSAHRAINPTTPSSIFSARPPITRAIPQGSRLYVSDYSSRARHAPIRLPPGPAYKLRNVPLGFSHSESLALAATWYLNPPSATRLGYLGSFELDILDFYRRPLQMSVEAFVTSRDPRFILENLRRASVEYVVTMDGPGLWNSLPLTHEEAPFFEQPVRVYRVTETWPRVRFETAQGELDPGTPRVLGFTDGRIQIEADVSRATRLVVAVANDSGWSAFVDGSEVPIQDNALAFVSIPLESGHHSVELAYRPPLILLGAAISALSLAFVLFLSARARAWRGFSTSGIRPAATPSG